MNKKKENSTNKKDFLRELAHRAQFTYSDVKILWDTIEEMIKEKIENLEIISLHGLFTIKPKIIKAHTGWDGIRKEKIELGDSYRITISPSSTLTDILRNKDDDDGDKKEE